MAGVRSRRDDVEGGWLHMGLCRSWLAESREDRLPAEERNAGTQCEGAKKTKLRVCGQGCAPSTWWIGLNWTGRGAKQASRQASEAKKQVDAQRSASLYLLAVVEAGRQAPGRRAAQWGYGVDIYAYLPTLTTHGTLVVVVVVVCPHPFSHSVQLRLRTPRG